VSEASVPQPGDWSGRRKQPSYQQGSEGERRFGSALNAAAAERGGCWVSHSLVLLGQRRDIDHLVVGPAGVTVIDTKAWDGRVWIGRLGLGRGRRAFPKEIDGVSRQINRVHSILAKAGRDDVPVTGVLCMVNDNPGIPATGLPDVRGVKIGRPRAVIHHALRDGPLDRATVDSLHWLLAAAFTIHGGSEAPTERAARRIARVPIRWRPAGLSFGRRIAIALVSLIVITAAAAVLISAVPRSVRTLTGQYRNFSRADLEAKRAEMKAVAVRRAHGPLHGRKVISTTSLFVVTYRRGKHCRVRQTVSRAAPIFGGGNYSTVVSGCRHRRPAETPART